MFKKFLIVVLSAACVMALASCGMSASAETAETAAEKADARETVSRAEWSLNEIAGLGDIVTGITDREYGAGSGAAYKIYEDVTYDRGIVYTVLFNTASVRFDTPGEYPMTYWVYFDAAALRDRTDAADMGFDIPDADRLAVAVHATVTVTDPEEDEGDEADEGLEETEAVEAVIGSSDGSAGSGSGSSSGSSSDSSGSSSKSPTGSGSSGSSSKSSSSGSGSSGSSSGASSGSSKSGSSGSTSGSSGSSESSSGSSGSSSKSGSSGSSGSSSGSSSSSSGSSSGSQAAECSHVWVEVTEEVAVRDERYVCNNCGFYTLSGPEILSHTMHVCGGCGYSVKNVTVGTQTVGTGTYVCSKCGATK